MKNFIDAYHLKYIVEYLEKEILARKNSSPLNKFLSSRFLNAGKLVL